MTGTAPVRSRPNVRRLIAEAMAIVASILLAFAIDAWWDARGDRQEERDAIAGLARDFESALTILQQDNLAAHDSAVLAARSLLELTGPQADAVPAGRLAGLLPPILRLPYFRPPIGTLDALIGSGDLRLIEDDSLRVALAAFPSILVDYNRTQAYGSDVVFGSLIPYLSGRISLRDFGLYSEGGSLFQSSVRSVLRDLEFESLIHVRLTNSQFALTEGRVMEDRIKRILELLARERIER